MMMMSSCWGMKREQWQELWRLRRPTGMQVEPLVCNGGSLFFLRRAAAVTQHLQGRHRRHHDHRVLGRTNIVIASVANAVELNLQLSSPLVEPEGGCCSSGGWRDGEFVGGGVLVCTRQPLHHRPEVRGVRLDEGGVWWWKWCVLIG